MPFPARSFTGPCTGSGLYARGLILVRLLLGSRTGRAKTIGTVTPNELHPKDSDIFWTGSGICLSRVLNITQKRGLDGNMTNCLKVDKRQKWVDHLFEQHCITSSDKYNNKMLKKIERRLPKKKL
jgi:hypothetical protein